MDAIERYFTEVESAIRSISRHDTRAVVDVLFSAWSRGATTYVIGNGGSASTASHMMNDLMKFTVVPDLPRFRAVALTDNVPLITALGNDLDYEDVFVEQLMNLLSPGDVLIALSGSGNSPNILKSISHANAIGAVSIGLCGSPGGSLAMLAQHRIIVPANHIGQQEDGHLVLNHAIATALRERILTQSVLLAGELA